MLITLKVNINVEIIQRGKYAKNRLFSIVVTFLRFFLWYKKSKAFGNYPRSIWKKVSQLTKNLIIPIPKCALDFMEDHVFERLSLSSDEWFYFFNVFDYFYSFVIWKLRTMALLSKKLNINFDNSTQMITNHGIINIQLIYLLREKKYKFLLFKVRIYHKTYLKIANNKIIRWPSYLRRIKKKQKLKLTCFWLAFFFVDCCNCLCSPWR